MNLHSIIFILKHIPYTTLKSIFEFTFYYIYIKTFRSCLIDVVLEEFTFYYIYIKTN